MRLPVAALLMFTLSGTAHAAWLLAADQAVLPAGAALTVTVANLDDDTPLPDTLPALLRQAGRDIPIELQARSPETGSGRRREYAAALPPGTVGFATLELADRPATRLLLQVGDAPPAAAAVAPPPASPSGRRLMAGPSGRGRLPALGAHEPSYFLLGTRESTTARFQLSFKYRMFDDESSAVKLLPPLSGLTFAYTQTSVWDLESNSKPFRDTSFKPSLFYQWGDDPFAAAPTESMHWTVQAGYEHESNGRDAASSRSIDTLFVRPALRVGLEGGRFFAVTPKLWTYLDKEDNPDIQHFRGIAELGLRYGRDAGWVVSGALRQGTRGFGSLQLDASYPLRQPILADAGGFLHLQYFNGYGETLLDYNVRRSPQFRIGFSIVR